MNDTLRITLAVALLSITQSALAHDPAEHAKDAEIAKAGPDCAAMKTMDHSKMDVNDPVMKAMMIRCAPAQKPVTPGESKAMERMDHSEMPKSATPKTPAVQGGR
ncbi:MAG: hypothetical protein V4709_02930 [Pseudomonadota bacterium]